MNQRPAFCRLRFDLERFPNQRQCVRQPCLIVPMNAAEHIAFYHTVAKFLLQIDANGGINMIVNSISPGAIATGIFGKALGLSTEAAEKTPAVMREVYKAAQPIPRAGLPDDIAHAAVFLASDESSFVNGHDLVVDGAITGGRNWTQQQQGYVALRKAFEQYKS